MTIVNKTTIYLFFSAKSFKNVNLAPNSETIKCVKVVVYAMSMTSSRGAQFMYLRKKEKLIAKIALTTPSNARYNII